MAYMLTRKKPPTLCMVSETFNSLAGRIAQEKPQKLSRPWKLNKVCITLRSICQPELPGIDITKKSLCERFGRSENYVDIHVCVF